MGLAREISEKAKKVQPQIARANSDKKNKILQKIAKYLEENMESILSANQKDLSNAEKNGANKALLDRLKLDQARIKALIKSIEEIIKLPDPVGQIVEMKPRPNGLLVGRMRIPLGVIATIYEARPGVTVDIASLCIKSGNAVILRGGSEALETNSVLAQIIKKAVKDEGIDDNIVGFINDPSREHIFELLKLEEIIDLVIPRGGEGLIRFVAENSRVPVLKHYKGVCHIFVDEFADLEKAYKICLNAKVQRPSVCNAMETLLVHEKIAEKFLPTMGKIFREHGVELRGCEKTREIIPYSIPATEDDWYAEYLDLILAVKVVSSIDEAIEHIKKYGSSHTEAIITENLENAMKFIKEVDSSSVMVNASTRFADGYEYGLGAEVGISTTKLHAYGPMGLEGLTTLKWIVFGNGHIRE